MTSEAQRPLETFIDREALLKRPHTNSVAIDPRNPLEIDDAIKLEPIDREKKEYRVAVHIADAGLLLGHTDIIDSAREQGWTQYDFRDTSKSVPMLPEIVYKRALGLDAPVSEGAPAVEVAFDFNMTSRAIGNIGVRKTRVQLKKYSYREHDEAISDPTNEKDNEDALERLEIARRLFAPSSGLNSIGQWRKSEDSVAYFMIAINRIMSDEIQATGTPWLFRNRTGLAYTNWRDERERRILERIKLGTYGSVPIAHEELKIDRYCHFTSPLRRFPDLANHLNLHAVMMGLEPPFQERDIDDIAQEMTALYIKRNPYNFTENVAA
jgi:exoribonuclease R